MNGDTDQRPSYFDRFTGQLIDAVTGHHVWAERYDRVQEDIFELRDEITENVVAALEPALGHAEMARAQRKAPENLDAWDLYQRGMWHFNRFTKEDFAAAHKLLRRASIRDPGFAQPLSGVATIRILEVLLAWADNPSEALNEAHRTAMSAVALDGMDPFASAVLG